MVSGGKVWGALTSDVVDKIPDDLPQVAPVPSVMFRDHLRVFPSQQLSESLAVLGSKCLHHLFSNDLPSLLCSLQGRFNVYLELAEDIYTKVRIIAV